MDWLVWGLIGVGTLAVLAAVIWPQLLANRVVGAVYRAALGAAEQYGGLEWLRSPDGVAYRKALVRRAYAVLPSPLGPVHWKLLLSEDRFCSLVELAFLKVVSLADDLQP